MLTINWTECATLLDDFPSYAEAAKEEILELGKAKSLEIKDLVSRVFKDIFNPELPCCIALAGSESRDEQIFYQKQKLEFMVVHLRLDEPTLTTIQSIFDRTFGLEKNCCEFYNLETNPSEILWSKNHEDVKIFTPTRVLDAAFVCGQDELFTSFKNSLIDQLRLIEQKTYKHLFHKSFTKRILKQSLEGCLRKNRVGYSQYDLEKSLVFYDGDTLQSTKYTHLRAIQAIVANCIFEKIRTSKSEELSSLKTIIKNIPPHTIERIPYIIGHGLFNIPASFESTPTFSEKLQDAYLLSLKCYSISKLVFEKAKKKSDLSSLGLNVAGTDFLDSTVMINKLMSLTIGSGRS